MPPVPAPKELFFDYYRCIKNLRYIPLAENNRLPRGYTPPLKRLLIEHLAYIRHATWRLQRPWPYTETPVPVRMIHFSSRNQAEIITPTLECKAYLEHQISSSGPTDFYLEHQMRLLCSLWSQELIESVEFMVLRKRLGPHWIPWIQTQVQLGLERESLLPRRKCFLLRITQRILRRLGNRK